MWLLTLTLPETHFLPEKSFIFRGCVSFREGMYVEAFFGETIQHDKHVRLEISQ